MKEEHRVTQRSTKLHTDVYKRQAFERETGLARVGPVGRGEGRLLPQRALVDFAVGWMEERRLPSDE